MKIDLSVGFNLGPSINGLVTDIQVNVHVYIWNTRVIFYMFVESGCISTNIEFTVP